MSGYFYVDCNLYCTFIVCALLRFKNCTRHLCHIWFCSLYLEIFFICFGVSSQLRSPWIIWWEEVILIFARPAVQNYRSTSGTHAIFLRHDHPSSTFCSPCEGHEEAVWCALFRGFVITKLNWTYQSRCCQKRVFCHPRRGAEWISPFSRNTTCTNNTVCSQKSVSRIDIRLIC